MTAAQHLVAAVQSLTAAAEGLAAGAEHPDAANIRVAAFFIARMAERLAGSPAP